MDASDLIKALQNTLQGGGRPHMENHALRLIARRFSKIASQRLQRLFEAINSASERAGII